MSRPSKKPRHDFSQPLAHVIEPTGGPGVELATLADAARFIGLCQPWRQARPHWDHCAGEILKAAETRRPEDIVEAIRCLDVALRRDNWL
jgi:glutamine amidotransferase PdxT